MNPPAQAGLHDPTPNDDLEYVGFWIRVVASLVDSILVVMVTAPLGYFILGSSGYGGSLGFKGPPDFLISVVLPAAAIVVFWIYRQATPGKMMFSARIVDASTGAAPDTGQLLLRYLGYYVSMLFFGLGFVWIGIDPRKQGWHDKIARTVVVRPKVRIPPRR